MYRERIIKGNISELCVMRDLLSNGKRILCPYGNSQRYDFIFEDNDKFYRVQVKSGILNKDGSISVNPFSISKGVYKSYFEFIDFFGIYCIETNKSYLLSIEKIHKDYKFKSYRIFNENKKQYEIERKFENNAVLKFNYIIDLVRTKIVLNHLGMNKENFVLIDRYYVKHNNELEHNFSQYIIQKDGLSEIDHFLRIEEKDCIKTFITLILMSNGCVVIFPVGPNYGYDFVIEDKCSYIRIKKFKNQKFYRVKIIINEIELERFDDFFEEYSKNDYIAFYDQNKNTSYLIPVEEIEYFKFNRNIYIIIENPERMFHLFDKEIGELNEMKIASLFMKTRYNVYVPITHNERYDLVINKTNNYYMIQVKSGWIYQEKEGIYIRFEASSQKADNSRINYTGFADFIAVVSINTGECYLIDINNLGKTDGKMKLGKEINAKTTHYGTIWAEDQSFDNIDKIIYDYDTKRRLKNDFEEKYKNIKVESEHNKLNLELTDIIKILTGEVKLNNIVNYNDILQELINSFKKENPQGRIEYQGILTVNFRDFLIDIPKIKKVIIEKMKREGYYDESENRSDYVYKFISEYYINYNEMPVITELYQKFLNFKSYELRGILRRAQKDHF